jgi:purine nucleoside permease
MRITKGKVINGHIEVEDEILDEGSSVTVLVSDESTFTLTDQEEAALLESITEANRGDLLDANDVLGRLP